MQSPRRNAPTVRPYLCGPINGCTDTEAKGWRGRVQKVFPYSIDPMVRDYRGQEDTAYREIVDLDKRDVRECDVVVVNYDKPSVGTSMEVFYAHSIGKPVILWCKPDARISPWLRYHSTTIVHSLEELVQAVHRCS